MEKKMFCPKCGSFICLPEDKCTICGYIKKSNKKPKNKKQKNNTKNKKTTPKNKKSKNNVQKMKKSRSKKSKNKQKNKQKNKRKYNPSLRLGGKTRFWNQKSFNEFEVLGNSYSSYYF